jgi:hypothetical protein
VSTDEQNPQELPNQETTWQNLFLWAENWKNDAEFELFEIQFLKDLIDSNFINLLDQENLDELRELQKDVLKASQEGQNLIKQIDAHMHQIAEIIDAPFTYDASVLGATHQLLQDSSSTLSKKHKIIKITTFNMIKDIFQHDRPPFTWNYN